MTKRLLGTSPSPVGDDDLGEQKIFLSHGKGRDWAAGYNGCSQGLMNWNF